MRNESVSFAIGISRFFENNAAILQLKQQSLPPDRIYRLKNFKFIFLKFRVKTNDDK